MLSSAWKELFLLGVVTWGLPVEHLVSRDESVGVSFTNADREEGAAVCETISRLKDMNLDPTEITCLKAIAMFKPGQYVMKSMKKKRRRKRRRTHFVRTQV